MTGRSATVATTRGAGWLERVYAWRDRLLASPTFQRRAARFVLTRPIARRRARELFDLVAGFAYSQVLRAGVELHLFELLAEGPQTAQWLGSRLGLTTDAAQRLLDAAVSLRLVTRRAGARYGLGALGAPLVGNTAVAAMVRHHSSFYADLADPVALLRASPEQRRACAVARDWCYEATADPDRVAAYSDLMAATQPLVAGEIVDAHDFRRHRCVLDVGGGDGCFLETLAPAAPDLQLLLFDLPAVAHRARARFAAAGLTARARAVGGSFLLDPLPRGADVATLVRVLHDHDDAAAMTILRAVHAALPPGAPLLIAEPLADTRGARPMGDAYFGFYLLAMGRGRPRRDVDLARMLTAAGFDAVRRLPTRQPIQTGLLRARRGPDHKA
jgi:demethylspheroidene O-methyltransferase